MPEHGSKVKGASRLSNVWNFFGAIQMISFRDWWPWTKPGYITMTRRQSNNQWNGGIVAHSAQKFRGQKSVGKLLASIFFGSRQHPPLCVSSKGPNCQRGILLISAGAIEGHFEGQTPREIHQGVLFLHDNAPRNRALATQKKLAYLCFQCLDHPPYYYPDLPRRTTTCSLDWKNNWKVAIFRPKRRLLLLRRPGWTDNILSFFARLAEVIETG